MRFPHVRHLKTNYSYKDIVKTFENPREPDTGFLIWLYQRIKTSYNFKRDLHDQASKLLFSDLHRIRNGEITVESSARSLCVLLNMDRDAWSYFFRKYHDFPGHKCFEGMSKPYSRVMWKYRGLSRPEGTRFSLRLAKLSPSINETASHHGARKYMINLHHEDLEVVVRQLTTQYAPVSLLKGGCSGCDFSAEGCGSCHIMRFMTWRECFVINNFPFPCCTKCRHQCCRLCYHKTRAIKARTVKAICILEDKDMTARCHRAIRKICAHKRKATNKDGEGRDKKLKLERVVAAHPTLT